MIDENQYYRRIPAEGTHRTEILVRTVGRPGLTHGLYGYRKIEVVTVLPDGRETNRRRISIDQFHQSDITLSGAPRRSGYVRVSGDR